MPREMIRITRAANIGKRKGKNDYSCRFRIPVAPNSLETYWSPWFKFTAKNAVEKESAVMKIRQELEDEINGKTISQDAPFGKYAREFHENRKDSGELNELSWDREELVIKQIESSTLAPIAVKNLISSDIEFCIRELRKDPDFSENKVTRFFKKVNQILKYATKHRVIPFNPCDAIEFKDKSVSTERTCLPDEVLFTLYEALSDDPTDSHVVIVRIVVETGFRRGEGLGLTVGDLDFKNLMIRLRRQVNSNHQIELPKYESIRDVPMSESLAEYLLKWLQFLANKFFDGNIASIPADFPLCPDRKGGFYRPNNFDKWRRGFFTDLGLGTQDFVEDIRSDGKKITRRVNYQGYDLHELRHTAISNMLASGGDLISIQNIAGHQKLGTTQTYLHAKENMKKKTVQGYSDFLNKKKVVTMEG